MIIARAFVVLLFLLGPDARAEPPATASEPSGTSGVALKARLLPGVVRLVERGLRVEVVKAASPPWPKPYRDATERFHAQVRLGADGELLHYIAGLPFVDLDANDPEVATKIMWNHAFSPWAPDDAVMKGVEWATGGLRADQPMRLDAGSNVQADQEDHSKFVRLLGRLYVDPVYSFDDNRDQVAAMRALGPTFPSLKRLVPNGPLLTYRYLGYREDDVWYYVSFIRRLRRLPPQIRYQTPGEVVIDLNSSAGFAAPIPSYSWRLLGERPMLGVMNAAGYPLPWCDGGGDFSPCAAWEERTVYVVEGTARLPYDGYAKRVIAIDKDAWVALSTDLYDLQSELWKTVLNFWSFRDEPGGEKRLYLLGGAAVDLQFDRAFRWRLPNVGSLAELIDFDTGLTPDAFSIGRIGSAFR